MVLIIARSRLRTTGYNPYHEYRARPADCVLLAPVFVTAIGLLARVSWADQNADT
jgi:hypothetical protein